jgi:hypothetical protein
MVIEITLEEIQFLLDCIDIAVDEHITVNKNNAQLIQQLTAFSK